jgi:hypothetical protein
VVRTSQPERLRRLARLAEWEVNPDGNDRLVIQAPSGAGRCRCVLNDAGIDGYLTTQPNVVVDLLKDDA